MSPRFYGFLWVLFSVSAGTLWLAGVFTMLTVVVFGFIAFGLVFVGMMCVLPGAVSHSPVKRIKISRATILIRPAAAKTENVPMDHVHFPIGLRLR